MSSKAPRKQSTQDLKLHMIRLQVENSYKVSKIVNEYDPEIPQSQTADNPVAPQGRAAQPSWDTR